MVSSFVGALYAGIRVVSAVGMQPPHDGRSKVWPPRVLRGAAFSRTPGVSPFVPANSNARQHGKGRLTPDLSQWTSVFGENANASAAAAAGFKQAIANLGNVGFSLVAVAFMVTVFE